LFPRSIPMCVFLPRSFLFVLVFHSSFEGFILTTRLPSFSGVFLHYGFDFSVPYGCFFFLCVLFLVLLCFFFFLSLYTLPTVTTVSLFFVFFFFPFSRIGWMAQLFCTAPVLHEVFFFSFYGGFCLTPPHFLYFFLSCFFL